MTERERHLLIVLAAASFECVLIAVTYRLWLGGSDFPAVPLIGWSFSNVTRRILGIGLIGSCGATVVMSCRKWMQLRQSTRATQGIQMLDTRSELTGGLPLSVRLAASVTAVFALLCAVANQHCLQAWHWLFLIVMSFAAALNARAFLASIALVLASVYLCSGLSRITLSSQPNATEMIVQSLMKFILPAQVAGDLRWISIFSIAATCGEIFAGILLLSRRTQRSGLIMAVLMHLSLMLALGPLGLNHHWGVILWNTFFLCLMPLAFLRKPQASGMRLTEAWPGLCLLAFSLSGLVGIADNWPSWQLYSSRPETWELWLETSAADQLPPTLKPYLSTGTITGDWAVLKLDRWSLAATGAPIYPEDRFLCAVIEDVIRPMKQPVFRVLIDEPELAWWKRRTRELNSVEGLEQERQQAKQRTLRD